MRGLLTTALIRVERLQQLVFAILERRVQVREQPDLDAVAAQANGPQTAAQFTVGIHTADNKLDALAV